MTKPHYPTFLKERLGPNYVVVQRRRKEPRYDRQGHLQQQVLLGEHHAAEREYRALYGDPYDAVRAELYRAAKSARLMLYAWKAARKNLGFADDHAEMNDTISRLDAALAAEVAR